MSNDLWSGRLTMAVTALALGLVSLAIPAAAQFPGGQGLDADRGRLEQDFRMDRPTVSIRVVPVGNLCVRAVEAVGYDPRLNQRLYRVGFSYGPMMPLGVTAFENAFSGARTQNDALRALNAAQTDAQPYRRNPAEC